MCGIAGYLNFQNRRSPDDIQATISRMNAAIAHRGPDNRGQWADPENYCHLGHTRLSILDLSAEGHQPMTSHDERYVITFNGEIYNFRWLRGKLEKLGHQFRTGTDTEVLLAGFSQFGIDLFPSLDGMFALAIYDRETGRLTLARDRAGEKPLYYAAGDGFFAFASELRALLAVNELPVSLSEEALALYFTLRYTPAPYSILDPIRKLVPGTIMQIERDGRISARRFHVFSINQDEEVPAEKIDAYADALEQSLTQSLTDRLNSDVPLGMFLSSGVDSALACALLSAKLGRKVKTFTIGFEGDAGSEHDAARAIAGHLGTEHHEHIFSAADFDRICDSIGTLMDEPNGDRSCVPTYLLSEFTRKHVTVAISGDGGDELFGGYSRYPGFAAAYDQTPGAHPVAMVQAYIERGLPVYPAAAVEKAFPAGYGAVRGFHEMFAPVFMHLYRPALHALRQLDFDTYLPGAVLAKVDRMSMRHGLEVRTPFLHPVVMGLASRASLGICMTKQGVQKAVLRNLLMRYLPKELALAPKKGFGMPASVFLNNAERINAELNAAYQRLSGTRFFRERPTALGSLFMSKGLNANALWSSIVLAKWVDSVERPL
ncbi:MAG TPA: asparagine synthase (glutamine-hydrolyzing) [Ferrovibrio sp.]|uniref:asparagine synthase (glutamine-hydrolyzing) n=1 Tax=Ferrovibrio sp. TaxID=1917215 RepID=UPI002B4ABB32|nr:asparagine synthase (glutamine-hydrolyzing) [Ferrovibrio sp.]HLT76251.1 asparagine synthase (glutamine-hydrolyzing) [Ferrovibrio sp.]